MYMYKFINYVLRGMDMGKEWSHLVTVGHMSEN